MARLPVVSGREVVRALERAGFALVSQEGSHVKLRKEKEGRRVTAIIPLHPELARKTLLSVLRQVSFPWTSSGSYFRPCLSSKSSPISR